MRIAVMGAGAVGGYFGAKLAAAGNEVVFIARGAHLAALIQSGLRVQSFQGDLEVRDASFVDNPAGAGNVDLVLFCVKSYDTDAAAKVLAPLMIRETRVLSLQNGVDNAARIARICGSDRTLAGVAYIGAEVSCPGTVRHSSGGRIVLGELGGDIRESTVAIQRAFLTAQVPCELSAEIIRAQWRKLLWNAPFCAISCLTRATVKEIIQSESLRKLSVECMAEVAAAAGTQGISLDPAWIDETLRFSDTLGDFKPSMLQDLEAGKPLEFEAFNGIVVGLLGKAGRSAPVNEVFYAALKYLDKKIRAGKAHEG